MPRNSLASVEIDVGEQTKKIARPEADVPFRILLAGNFSGGAKGQRRLHEVDPDNCEQVMARIAPALELKFGDKELTVPFQEMDDFHPDRLIKLEPFRALRDLREQLSDRSTFAAAARKLAPPDPPAGAPAAGPDTGKMSGADLLAMMTGEPAGAPKSPAPAAAARARVSDWDQMIRNMVAPYAEAAADPRQAEMVAQTDRAIEGELRAVLHHPAFQALEASWKSVDFLLRRLEIGENVRLFIVDITKDELCSEGGASALREICGDEEWGVIAGMYSFGPGDGEALQRISVAARAAGAPFISGLGLDVIGANAPFAMLRESAYASWIGLAMPRFMLRLPYGKEGSQIESFQFEEMPEKPDHRRYLWGNPSVVCAFLLGETFTRFGWDMRPGAVLEIDSLPMHVYKEDGESQLKPVAEVLLTIDSAEKLLDLGFMPLATIKNTGNARLVRFQSVAEPLAALSGRWS
jgi:type VI secretion system protein ImpC